MTRIVDLTMRIDDDTPTFPADPDAKIEQFATVGEDGYAVKELSFSSHFSTHIDAPAHMVPDGKTLDEFGVERFVGEAVVVDVRGQDEIEVYPEVIEDVEMVFFWTGHAELAREGGEEYYQDFPVITEETARSLVESGVGVVGIDSFTPDDEPYPVHDILLGNDVLLLENLVNLGAVSGERFECYALPLKVADGDGAPCRVVGVLR